tara:strand:+ start:690 stop:1361 length:672 start_codon:yes stop_codon:yes gene_type:complete
MSASSTYDFYKDSDDPLFGGASKEAIQKYYDDISGLSQDEIEQKNISLIDSGGVGASYGSGGSSGGGFIGQTPASFDRDTALQLQSLVGQQSLAVEKLRQEGALALGQVAGAASMFGSSQDTLQQKIASEAAERASNYASYMSSTAQTNVAEINAASQAALQSLDNEGKAAVAQIMGSWNTQNSAVQGAYQNENTRIAGQYQKDVAKMNQNASLFGSLFSGFW